MLQFLTSALQPDTMRDPNIVMCRDKFVPADRTANQDAAAELPTCDCDSDCERIWFSPRASDDVAWRRCRLRAPWAAVLAAR